MENINEKVHKASYDMAFRENFINESKQTILHLASKALGKYITDNDDEWSIAMFAYNKCIDTYTPERGEFLSYAQVVIKRALIDYYRSEKKHSSEMTFAPDIIAGEGDIEETSSDVFKAVSKMSIDNVATQTRAQDLRDEILEINDRLKKYGFSFYDLTECSPKARKTKKECARAISAILENKDMIEAVETGGKIPASRLKTEYKISTKLLDKYRRYIIMAIIVLNGEYPLLADYLQYVRKEDG